MSTFVFAFDPIRRRTRAAPLRCHGRTAQGGTTLVVALILLLVVTLVAVAGMQNTVLQERMAGNLYDRNLAFQQAEAGLRDAQRQIPAIAGAPIDAGTQFSPSDPEGWADLLSASAPRSFDTYVERLEIPEQQACPENQVCDEAFGEVTMVELYRITSLGVGGSTDAIAILQATVRAGD